MDAKDLRAEAALTERCSDGGAKFTLQYDRSKCHDVGGNAFKGDTAGARPCAVIGPDRVVPPVRDCPKKVPAEPWLAPDPMYRRLSDYPHKMSDHKDPTRNISPRQTFQENMQRIIMPPGYNAMKLPDDSPYPSKTNKLNVPLEVKYCEVPYNINPVSSDQKHIRNSDHSVHANPLLMRGVPHGWPAGSVNVRPLRPYGAPEVLQYPDYANCPGPRPVLTRTHSSGQEELQPLYPDPYYHESNVRFKPYPNIKERYPQTRYEYLGNYSNPYQPPHPFAHKYELPKTIPQHTYSGYPPVPVKYTERVSESVMDSYQRAFSHQGNYNVPIRNPVIHPPYRPVPGNQMHNKHPYPPDGQHKSPVPSKLAYDSSNKMYLDYDTRSKPLAVPDNYYQRPYHAKNTIVLPNYAPTSMHTHPYYIKENMPLKSYEYARFKNMDPSMINHSLTKLPPQFSPSTLAISPADSNASNETVQTHGTSQEDCGYVSQSSVTSVRSIESLNRIPMDLYGRYDYRYGPVVRTSSTSKPDPNSNSGFKSKKDIRQFISSWSEGDDENAENSAKRDGVKHISDSKHTFNKQYEAINNQEQLYVLGLVNVPSEELGKYEHIQKVSKLPENIKGYNSLELLNQFEEAIESSNITSVKPTPRTIQMPLKSVPHKQDPIPRAVSPLDVEAKISQSVIHKEVGCNFEIKPCSPKMMNVEVATPMQTLLNERVIEKVANPHNIKSPIVLQSIDENIDSSLINKSIKCPIPNTASSCKMINGQHLSESSSIDNLKTNYSLQDLESNSGVCLASLPRLDTDIELNFPEVNQQFINANKTESVITASFTKDLPTLEVDRSGSTLKNTIARTEYDINYQFSPKMETETDFSRLSKYRKLKRTVPDDKDTALAKAQATRVDSVIIKNPDNTKSLEDGNDTLISGGYYRNNFQEFAMNLVSQAKNLKAHQDQEVDNMLSASTSNASASKYDEVSIHSPSSFPLQKSGNLLTKSFNVTEETSRNNTVHAQSDNLTTLNKDLSNRYLEKASLDMPMNLSPQAKYPITGIDDEIKINRSNDNIKRQEAMLDTKLSEEKQKTANAMSLDKTDTTTVNDLESENLIVASEDHIHEQQITNLNNSSSSSDFSKEHDNVEMDKSGLTLSHIDKVHLVAACGKQIDELNFQENTNKSREEDVEQTNDISDDKKELLENGFPIEPNDKINHNDVEDHLHRKHDIDRKKYDRKLYVSKLKRKKYKTEVTHRKRTKERRPFTNTDKKFQCDRKYYNLKTSLNSEKEDFVRQPMREEPMILSDNIIAEGKIKTKSRVISEESTDKCKNITTAITLENAEVVKKSLETDNASDKYSEKDNIDTHESMTNNIPDCTNDNMAPSSCLLNKDKRCRISSTRGREAIAENNLSRNINIKCTQHDEKQFSHRPTSTDTNTYLDEEEMLPFDQFKSKGKFSQVVSDHEEKQNEELLINASFDSKKEELDRAVFSAQDEKLSKEKLINTSSDCKKNELNTSILLDQNKIQNHKEFESVLSKREDIIQDIQMYNYKDCSKHDKDFRHGKTTKNKQVYHSYVNKELFSPRFQNLLFLNENYDVGKKELANTESAVEKTDIAPHELVIQDKGICATHEVGIIMNTAQGINESSDETNVINNLILGSSKDIEINIHKLGMTEEVSKEKLDEKLDIISTKDIHNTNDNDLKVEIKNETLIDKEETNSSSSNVYLHSYDNCTNYKGEEHITENQATTIADTIQKAVKNIEVKSSGDEIVTEYDKDLGKNEDNHELDSSSVNDIEMDTCGPNIIVIDETTSLTSGDCDQDSKMDMSNDEFDRKLQSFYRNVSSKPRFSLKRSLSDSDLNTYDCDIDQYSEKRCFMLPKRKKLTDIGNIDESHLLNIIQSSRRNSISTLCNENFSFCILIDDNCIVTEENYEQENDLVQFDDDSLNPALKDSLVEDEKCASSVYNTMDQNENSSDTYFTKSDEEKAWVDDVGCEETIVTEDIAENIVIGEPTSPKDSDLSDYESDEDSIGILNNDAQDHTSKVKHIYGDNMCTNDALLVDALYRTPQMDVNKKLMDRESQVTEKITKYYDSDSLETLLAEPINNIPHVAGESNTDADNFMSAQATATPALNIEDKDSTCLQAVSPLVSNLLTKVPNEENIRSPKSFTEPIDCNKSQDETIHSCESSLDNVFSYIHKGDNSYPSSSSPEVSSTTSEEKNSSILLNISNFKGSRTSEVNTLTCEKQKESSCKFTEKEYLNPIYNNGLSTHRPLITKAAQKYIPPLRESVPDLKVKLALPQQSLLKLQKNKVAKEEPKFSTRSSTSSNINNIKLKKEIPKKFKPKFEDVLKNIDEVQFQMHKEKNKKPKKYIPKVVIKKSENGSHYASTSTKESFNPDLTGRKWQPWVFIEKNQFIDKMALRNKTRATFSHRRKSFVLTEKVCRYKSISSAKFIISQPKMNDFPTGNLKYTIKLKHTY